MVVFRRDEISMDIKERLTLRISRIKRLLARLEERMNRSAWMDRRCCRESTERRARRLMDHLKELVDNLEIDVILAGAGVLK